MAETPKLNHPWLIAVWPGMGQVGLGAGYFLMAKLKAEQTAEFAAPDLFDVEQIGVKRGLILPIRLPKSRLFLWRDPQQRRDLLIFLGEAQPPLGKLRFCSALIDHAVKLGVERVITFAAMATDRGPSEATQVYAAATDRSLLDQLGEFEIESLEDGQIGGLNGVLLGAANAAGISAACLLGEMPHVFAQFPYAGASLAILRKFTAWTQLELDLGELEAEATALREQFAELWHRAEHALRQPRDEDEEDEFQPELDESAGGLTRSERQRIEELFEQAAHDRSRAYELKRELDRLNVFAEYEDRFLDLFKASE